LRKIAEKQIVFVDIDDSVLREFSNSCEDPEDADEPFCLSKENGAYMQLVLPKRHLITEKDNEVVYFGRLADELVRNGRTKRLFFDKINPLLNPSIETSYSIHQNEFIIVQSALTPEYFASFEDQRGKTNYSTARPSVSVLYSNDPIPISSQLPVIPPTEKQNENANETQSVDENAEIDCVDRVIDPIGNPVSSQWRKYLPKEGVKEMVFRDSTVCAAEMMAHIFRETGHPNVKNDDIIPYLVSAYETHFKQFPQNVAKFAETMRKQGKSQIFESLTKRPELGTSSHFVSLVKSNKYNITDLDIWILASTHNLPIIVFNPNGLKGFGAKEIQWIKMGGEIESDFFFIRSNIASIANKVYEYNLIVPRLRLVALRDGFQTMVYRAIEEGWSNVESVDSRFAKIVHIPKGKIQKGGTKRSTTNPSKNKKTKRKGVHYMRW